MSPIDKATMTRILVALDTSPHSLAALEAATELAALLQAELVGLFVEDADLLRLASLPFARELLYAGQAEKRMDGLAMERALKAEAEQIRRALQTSAGRRQVQWSFRVARGRVLHEVLMAAEEVDIVVMGQAGRRPGPSARVGTTARAIASQAPRTVAFLRPGSRLEKPVVVVFDASRNAVATLTIGARLAEQDHRNLMILLSAPIPEESARLREQVGRWLSLHGLSARTAELRQADPHDVIDALRRQGGRLLVLGADSPLAREESLDVLFRELGHPIIVAR
jgi:nucleotide-binding universal stress UspA family protein